MKAGMYMKLKIFTALLCVLLMLSVTVTAYGESDKKGSINVTFEQKDVEFELHKIGYIKGSAVKLYDEYGKYNVNMESVNAANTLTAYVKRDKLEPYRTAVTNDKGNADFKDLERGVYLLIGEDFDRDGLVYRFKSSIVCLPYTEDGAEHWDLNVEIKYEKDVYEYEPMEIKVLKVWLRYREDNKYPAVNIQLLRDWEVYDTVTLNDTNDWKHKWENLDNRHHWCIVEDGIAQGYLVDIGVENELHTVTNTGDMETPTDPSYPTQPQTTNPVNTVPTSPTRPTVPTQPKTTPRDDSSSSTDFLPQTGQLNWPVPVLVCVGASLIILGIALMRKQNEKQ